MDEVGLREAFQRLLENPSRDTYVAVAATLFADPSFSDAGGEIAEVEDLLGKQENGAVLEKLREALPNGLLSPRLHMVASRAYEALGHDDEAQSEQYAGYACATGSASTGDGTREAPYVVTGIGDEYDLLSFLGKHPLGQSLTELDGRHFDVFRLEDDSEVWFDIEPFFVGNLIERREQAQPGAQPDAAS